MKRMLWLRRVILIQCFLFGCSSDQMPNYSIIQSLRVLALVLDQPEVNYDSGVFTPSSVSLTPWVSDLYGNGRSLSMNIYSCLDPGVGIGATPTCAGSPSLNSVIQKQVVAPSTSFSGPNFTGSLAPVSLPLAGIVPPPLSQQILYNGYAILVFFEIYSTNNPSEKVTSFKRLIFSGSPKTKKNQNPGSVQVKQNGIEITSLPIVETNLNADVPDSETETYSVMDGGGNLGNAKEELETAWFLTGPADIVCSKKKECTPDGILSLKRSKPGELNLFTPPKVSLPSSRGRVLIAVAKDSRGGVVVKRYCDGLCP